MIVSRETPEPVTAAGPKLAVAPVGNPDTLRLTVPLNPFTPLTDTLGYPTLPPAAIDVVAGVVVTLKSAVPVALLNETLSKVPVVTAEEEFEDANSPA